MEAKTAYAGGCVVPGNRENLGHPRHVPVEGRIKAGDLWQVGKGPAKRLDQGDLPRQVCKVQWVISPELRDQSGCYQLVIQQVHPTMNDPMADPGDCGGSEALAHIRDQAGGSTAVVGRVDGANFG